MKPRAYYNENDAHAAQWLRNLIDAGEIMDGDVDDRSIEDVTPADLEGYTRCHFFAGIGLWDLALTMAGFPEDAEVWTGSCPCQPFSSAGKQKGFDDARHLWPTWARLIGERKPSAVFGEQVSGSGGVLWLDAVRTDLEDAGYAVAALDIPACSVGAPHIRNRLYWVGDSAGERRNGSADTAGAGRGACAEDNGRLGHADDPGSQGRRAVRQRGDERATGASGVGGNPWSDLAWVECSDGRARPVPAAQPELFPLAHGNPGRVGQLRAYGNAIVPQVAAEFIGAYMEAKA